MNPSIVGLSSGVVCPIPIEEVLACGHVGAGSIGSVVFLLDWIEGHSSTHSFAKFNSSPLPPVPRLPLLPHFPHFPHFLVFLISLISVTSSSSYVALRSDHRQAYATVRHVLSARLAGPISLILSNVRKKATPDTFTLWAVEFMWHGPDRAAMHRFTRYKTRIDPPLPLPTLFLCVQPLTLRYSSVLPSLIVNIFSKLADNNSTSIPFTEDPPVPLGTDKPFIIALVVILVVLKMSMICVLLKRRRAERRRARQQAVAVTTEMTASTNTAPLAPDPMTQIFLNSSTASLETQGNNPPPAYTAKDQHLEFTNDPPPPSFSVNIPAPSTSPSLEMTLQRNENMTTSTEECPSVVVEVAPSQEVAQTSRPSDD